MSEVDSPAATATEPAGRRRGGARRRVLAAVAGAAVLALGLSGCTAFAGALSGLGFDVPPQLPEEPAGTVEGFGAQEPIWLPCGSGMQCSDIWAPLDWGDPGGEKITLRLTKHEASDAEPLGTLFLNPGGPGASGVEYLSGGVEFAVQEDVLQKYDVIGWDPRGVGRSTPVECLDAKGMDDYLFGDDETEDLEQGSPEWVSAAEAETREFGEACLERTGDLLGHVDTLSTVRDLDMLRAIVGDEKLNYLGYSYGTKIGAMYAGEFPERVGRLVLDGAMDPTSTQGDVVWYQTQGFELALKAYVTDCLKGEDCPFTGSVDEAMGEISEQLTQVENHPLRGSDGRPLTVGTMLTAIITPLYSESRWDYLDQLFTSVADGNADIALALADLYYDRENGRYLTNSTEAFSAINCLDYPAPELDMEQARASADELAKIAPTIGRYQGYGEIGCYGWPIESHSQAAPITAAGADPILVLGTTGDPATPYSWAVSLADQLESGVLVTRVGEGHTAYGENDCINDVVDDYLLTGAVPASDPRCE